MTRTAEETVSVVLTPWESAAAQALIAELQQEYVVRYGVIDETPVDATEFDAPEGLFLVMYLGDEPVGCAGLRRTTAAGGAADVELKRMFVRSAYRGRGLSKGLLAEVERHAVELGADRLVLETGTKQPEAIGLYVACGYTPIPSFGYYRDAPLNRCFAKALVA